jgi:hypothetical protein
MRDQFEILSLYNRVIEVLVGPMFNLFLWLAKMGGGNPELVVAVYLGEKWWGTLPL